MNVYSFSFIYISFSYVLTVKVWYCLGFPVRLGSPVWLDSLNCLQLFSLNSKLLLARPLHCFTMTTSDSILLALSLLALTNGVVSLEDVHCRMSENSTYSDGGKKIENWWWSILTLSSPVMYEGQCRDLYEDGLCGLGERLFVRGPGAHCDCDEVEDTQDTSRIFDD